MSLTLATRFFVVNTPQKRTNLPGDGLTLVIAGRVHNNAWPMRASPSTESRSNVREVLARFRRSLDLARRQHVS